MRMVAALLLGAAILAPTAQAASNKTSINICAELRSGTNLASLEIELEASGYTPRDAGSYTGTVIRDHCPELIPAVKAQLP